MFFPHDVSAAGLEGLKTGDNLRFRPRVEGQATIATDLKAVSGELSIDDTVSENVMVDEDPVPEKIGKPPKVQEIPEASEDSVTEAVGQPRSGPKARRKPARKQARAAKAAEPAVSQQPEASSGKTGNKKQVLRLKKSEAEARDDFPKAVDE